MSAFQPKTGSRLTGTDGRSFVLDQEIGKGGEGSVWSVNGDPSIVAKFYHNGLGKDGAKKIEAMCRLQSESLLRIAAWPTAMLNPGNGAAAEGLLMRRISGYQPAHQLYTPKSRRVCFPEAQFPFIVHATLNIARAFATVHEVGQVIGDVNHGNLLISNSATVALIDCDSFEINDGRNVYPCLVGVPDYTAPELQGKSFVGVRRTTQHDAFGLAVLIFHMLFLGRHPFAGIFRQGTSDKTIEEAIREYRFAYLPDTRVTEMEPPRPMIGLAHFPGDIGQLFIRAFNRDGSAGCRPAAHEWIGPLESLSRSLKRCSLNETHHYFQALASCPWCSVEKAFGRAMFGIKFTFTSGPDFDLIAVWTQIEAVDAKGLHVAAPTSTDYLAQCRPDARIPAIKKRRRKRRLLSAGVILLAVIMVGPGVIPAVPAICVLIVGLAAMVRLWQSARGFASEIVSDNINAARSYEEAKRRWDSLQHPPPAFASTKQKLQREKGEFQNLSTVRAQRLAELTKNLRQNQLTRFLERHHIEDATIPGIGPGRKTLLRCYNVEDASDVQWSRLNIKGFGPSLKSALMAWRMSIEQTFVFNPNAGIDPADIKMLDQELAQKRAALIQSLSTGSQQLRQVLLPWQVERANLVTNLASLAKALAQAELNIKALGRF